MKFAHIETGAALDVQPNATSQDYIKRYAPATVQGWVVAQVPDSTEHGAIDNHDGTFTNPTPPLSVSRPAVLTWGDLALYLIGLLGSGATGRAALGTIIKNCQASAQGADNFFAVYFQGQTTFTKAEFTGVLADVAVGIVSAGQKTAVANNWPAG